MYKLEDIKPKKYPDEKPSENRAYVNYRVLLDNGTQSLFNWNPISQSDGKMIWNKYVTWFIDIPNPPSELKFLAYPQNKPSEDGLYLVHYKPADDWGDIYYPDDNIWDEHIDYFIPYRLDEPVSDTDELDEPLGNSEQLERENEMDVKVFMDWDNKTGDVNITKPVRLEQGDFMAVVRRYLDNFSYNVVKREPEIKPCPNCGYEQAEYREDYGGCWICLNSFCRLAGPHDDKDGNKWNSLPRKEE